MYFTVWVVKQKRELQWKCRTAERYGPRGGAAWLTWNERMDSSNAGGPVLRQEEPQCWRRRAGIGFSVQKPWLWPVAGRKGPKEQPGWGRRHVVSWPLGGALQCRLAISMQFSSNCSYIAGRGGGGAIRACPPWWRASRDRYTCVTWGSCYVFLCFQKAGHRLPSNDEKWVSLSLVN